MEALRKVFKVVHTPPPCWQEGDSQSAGGTRCPTLAPSSLLGQGTENPINQAETSRSEPAQTAPNGSALT